MTAAATYADRVDAVLAQRTRLRGPQPPGDQFGSLPPNSPLLRVEVQQPTVPNFDIVASYVKPDDVIVDVGGGAGRFGLPLALRCREVINVDPSPAMVAAFVANARQAGLSNVRAIEADWLDVDPPRGSLVLVKHVTYLTRDIVPFIEKLELAATRRVLFTVNSPTPFQWHRRLFERIYSETEERAPGHIELMNVLWELGIEPDLQMLAQPASHYSAPPTREAAIKDGLAAARRDQWAHWPLGDELETRVRDLLDTSFDELFAQTVEGYIPTWPEFGREALITWEPRR